jgi:2-polyprenyl-3-methyl-5-hydroxy-6-metoxy-1,4-benzoquinol methylase
MENTTIDYSRHYKNWHSNTPEHINKMIQFYKPIISNYFPFDKSVELLDIGCGMGFLLLALKQNGYNNISGIDSDKSQVIACQKNDLNVHYVTDSIEYLKNNIAKYEVITAFDLLEHIPVDLQIEFLKAIFTSLRQNGKLILTVPNATSVLASRNRYIDFTHHVVFTEVSLDFVLYNAGFKDIEINPLDFITYSFSIKYFFHKILFKTFRAFRRLQMISELGLAWGRKVPLSFNLICKAEKS